MNPATNPIAVLENSTSNTMSEFLPLPRTLVDCASVRNYFAKLARALTSDRAAPKNTLANDKTSIVETVETTNAKTATAPTIAKAS